MTKKPFDFRAFTQDEKPAEKKDDQDDKFSVNLDDLEFIPPEEVEEEDDEEFEEVDEKDLPPPTKTIHVYEK